MADYVAGCAGLGDGARGPQGVLRVHGRDHVCVAVKTPYRIYFDAGQALTKDLDRVTTGLMDLIFRSASGEPGCDARHDEREIAIWKNGVTL